MAQLDKKKLRMLSPDADDWNDLVGEFDYLNQENAPYGVLLYPRKGITKTRADVVVSEWIACQHTISHGSINTKVKERGEDWAIIYQVTAWYNHFDLNEEYE